MSETDFRATRVLGRTGLQVSRIALAGGYKVPAKAVEKAFHEYGVNTFYWEARRPGMKDALRRLVPSHREDMVIAIQTYDHAGLWGRGSVERALKALGVECADILYLGWVNSTPWKRLLDLAERLREEGKVRFLGMTGHNRRFHGETVSRDRSVFDVHMVRYNAAHKGAEGDIFEQLGENRPGIVTYTATRWGRLLNPKKMPAGERALTAAECYRFVLSHPAVDCCLAGPRTEQEMDEGLTALGQGPLAPEEKERVRRIGDYVHG